MESNKLINFLNHSLNPNVVYNCVPDDLYKPENLISSSQESLNLGFMAYNVVKPPIDLIFNFSHNINIHVIKLWLKFNLNVKTTGVELYTMFNNQFVKVGGYNSYLEMKTSNSEHLLSSEGCLFYRSDLYPKYIDVPNNIEPLKFEKTYSLRSTNQIKVVLKNTNRCCVPVLKKIEVWGMPSRECSHKEVSKIYKLWNKVFTSPVTMYSTNDAPTTDSNDEIEVKSDSSLNSKIPEEYLDSITYEVMILPMVLPSGKLVDQITIERHTANEMTNGRCPSDPFTGLPFTSDRKPIYDNALKLQIDEFLLKHQNEYEVKIMPRAIGKKRIRSDNDNNITKWQSNQISLNSLKPSASLTTVNLDILVSNAVKNIKKARVTEKQMCDEFCSDCETKHGSEIVWYKITNCGHKICRNCLMNSKKPIKLCKLCSKEYTHCDLIKLNL